MSETYYDSPMTGAQLDEAFAGMTKLQDSVAQAAASAETARQYGQVVEQNAQAIGTVEENLEAIVAAPEYARQAGQSASAAAASAAEAQGFSGQAGQSAAAAAESARAAQQVAQGAQGWYETEKALKAAHPTGQNGQWAIIGSTDTIWTWDSDTGAWKNTSVKTDLSNYYTKSQTDGKYLTKASVLNLIYPVGSIYTSVNNVSPQTFLGGTWQQIQGRFLLAASNSYPAGSTGGSAQHNHTLGAGYAEIGFTYAEPIGNFLVMGEPKYGMSYTGQRMNSLPTYSQASGINIATPLGGSTDEQTALPPYLAVYMWKRTA